MAETAPKTPEQIAAERKQQQIDRAEAFDILNGKSLLLPDRRHLIAMARDAAVSEQRSIQLANILAAIVHDSGEPTLSIPGAFLQHVRETPILVEIENVRDGSVVVRKVIPTVKGSGSVN